MYPTAIVVGKRTRREVTLEGAVTVVGRDAGAGLELGDLQVSRRHALLIRSPRGTFVKDLGSRNGLLVNDRRVAARGQELLKSGDVLSLGRTTIIYKEGAGGAPPATATRIAAPAVAPAPTGDTTLGPFHTGDTTLGPAPAPEAPTPGPSAAALAAVAAAVPISDAVAPRAPAKPALAEPAEGSAPEPVIPRALPPASYGGSAEVLALRALYDRAERDRVHLRNLAVILFGLWTATLVLLALAVFGDWGRRQPASGEAAQPTPTAATDEPAAAEAPAATPVEIQGAAPAYVGQEVTLSAEVPLEGATVRWTLIDRPEGSLAEVATDPEGRAVLRPDRPGAYTLAVVARDGQASTSATATIHAVANPEAPEAPRWQDVAAALLGRPLSGGLQSMLEQAAPADRVDLILADAGLYTTWWDAELEQLGLGGPERPGGRPWDRLPERLQTGEVAAVEALSMLLLSRAWSARYPTAEGYVDGALRGLLGQELAREPSLVETARRLYDGHTATFLGAEVSDHLGLVHALTSSPEAATELLRRAATRARGAAPDPDALAIAAEQLHADPRSFFRLAVELALTRL